jgi:hypothetical protein
VPVKVAKPFGTCSVCEIRARVWEVESADLKICRICLKLLVQFAVEDLSQPS